MELPENTSIDLLADILGNVSNRTQIEKPTNDLVDSSPGTYAKAIKEETGKRSQNNVSKQLAFVHQARIIAISDFVDDQGIDSMLGKADEIKSHAYSYDDGLNMGQLNGMTEKQYKFPGLVIKTIDATEDRKSFIFSIEITDPKYPTVRSVKVGDAFDKLKGAYSEGVLLGDELSDEQDVFRYEPVNYADIMNFQIKDKKIESILMYKLID